MPGISQPNSWGGGTNFSCHSEGVGGAIEILGPLHFPNVRAAVTGVREEPYRSLLY